MRTLRAKIIIDYTKITQRTALPSLLQIDWGAKMGDDPGETYHPPKNIAKIIVSNYIIPKYYIRPVNIITHNLFMWVIIHKYIYKKDLLNNGIGKNVLIKILPELPVRARISIAKTRGIPTEILDILKNDNDKRVANAACRNQG